jgi:hypothetical protein
VKRWIIGIISAVVILGLLIWWLWSTPSCQIQKKDIQSNITGLSRTATLYANDGSIIKAYTFKGTIDTTDGIASFNDANGKRILLSGTYIIEEK